MGCKRDLVMKKQKRDIKAKKQQSRDCLGMMNLTLFVNLPSCYLNCFFYPLETQYFPLKNKFDQHSSRSSFCSERSQLFIDRSPVKSKTDEKNNKVLTLFYKTNRYFSSRAWAQFLTPSLYPLAPRWLFFLSLLCQLEEGRAEAVT